MNTNKLILELVNHIEEFITNHPKEVNDNYIEVVDKARKFLKQRKYEPSSGHGNSELVDAVIEEMKKQIDVGDWTCIDELLRFVPRVNLIQFLPEDIWEGFMNEAEKKEILNYKP